MSERARGRRRASHVVAWVLAAIVVVLGGIAVWATMPSRAAPAWIRVRTGTPDGTCDSVDLELAFSASTGTAMVRSWRPQPLAASRCVADGFTVALTSAQRKRAREASADAAGASLLGTIAFGTRRDRRTSIEWREGGSLERSTSRTFEGVVPEGVGRIEALYAELLAQGPDGPGPASVAGVPAPVIPSPVSGLPIRAADLRRADINEIIASLEADAVRQAPGAWLEAIAVRVQPGGEIDVPARPFQVTFQNAATSLSYSVRDGLASSPTPSRATLLETRRTSRCSSRDLWRKGIASGMSPSADTLVLMLGPRDGGGSMQVWQLSQGGSRPVRFDAATCARLSK